MNRFRGTSPQLTREAPKVGRYRRGPQLRTTKAGTWFYGLGPDDSPAGLLLVFPGVDLKVLLPTIARLTSLKVPGVLPAKPKLEVQAGRQWMVTTAPPVPVVSEVMDIGEHRTPGNAAALLSDVAQTLRVVHQNGLVHGSVTAKSVVVGPDGTGLLTDWATSKTATSAEDIAGWTKLAHALAESWCTELEAAAVLARAVGALTGSGWDAALEQVRPLAAEADRHSLADISATHRASPGRAAQRRRPGKEPVPPAPRPARLDPTAIPPDVEAWVPPSDTPRTAAPSQSVSRLVSPNQAPPELNEPEPARGAAPPLSPALTAPVTEPEHTESPAAQTAEQPTEAAAPTGSNQPPAAGPPAPRPGEPAPSATTSATTHKPTLDYIAEGLRWPLVLAALTIVALIGACTALLLPAIRAHGLSLGINAVTMQARKSGTVCTLVADINTNGGSGTIMYRWTGDIAEEPVMTLTANGAGEQLQLGRQWISSDSPIGDPVVTLQILEPQPHRASAQPAAGCR